MSQIHALLTLDLSNVTGKQRDDFNSRLEELKWKKQPRVTTTWRCHFEANSDLAAAKRTVESDVENAATFARIARYHAVVMFGPEPPYTFER